MIDNTLLLNVTAFSSQNNTDMCQDLVVLVFFSRKSQKLAVAYLNQEKNFKKIFEKYEICGKMGDLGLKLDRKF